jgi:CDP-diacylglycerol pyrophosphatase
VSLMKRAPALFILAALALSPRSAAALDPDALRQVVENICVPAETISATPLPCRLADLSGRYAVLKDLQGATQYLVVPTDTVTGIESPAVLSASAPNYWQDAWEARRFIEQSLGRTVPGNFIGLAINSESGRTQNQLHIHIDCIKPDVIRKLRANQQAVGTAWRALPVPLVGHPYMEMRIDASDLSRVAPFRLLAEGVTGARADMKDRTLVVLPTTFRNGRQGFYLLTDHVDRAKNDLASGEELLDHSCAVLAR